MAEPNVSFSLDVHFRVLQNRNPKHIVDAFVQHNPDPISSDIITALTHLSNIDLRDLIKQLIETIIDPIFKNQFFLAIKLHAENHPLQTAFIVIGIVLMCNPLGMAGFGSLGPVSGSIAAAWQSSIGGSVAAGSAFSILQRMGMFGSVAIPVAGAVVAAAVAVEQTGVPQGVRAAGNEVGAWMAGNYGEPVKNWCNGDYGTPVTNWWNGKDTPVANWWGHVTRR
ncbi:hypothetical protein B0H34DRAFT_676873 [Crassisporium funariophilum]|nr:hypothetical protein B0H34DRAFT_676873 [Crassisporium funariophilum]